MQRTLQTTDLALGFLIKRGIPAIALAEWQETTTNQIDIGSPVSKMSKEWPQFDWSHMDPVFPAKEGLYEFSEEGLLTRGAAAKRWLKNRHENVIAVVSHAGFLRTGICNRKFDNADFRIFEFAAGEVEGAEKGLRLVESELTANKGGGMGRSPDGFFGWEKNDFKYMPKYMGKGDAYLKDFAHASEAGHVSGEADPK
jgi:broad specificity phosphatase PhoE